MAGFLKRTWIAFKEEKFLVQIIAGIMGTIVGLSGCVAFAFVFHNFKAALWAWISSLYAGSFLIMHNAVRRDVERLITRKRFNTFMYCGLGGAACGMGMISACISEILRISIRETGEDIKRPIIVSVWAFITIVWGLMSFLAGRKFRKSYFETEPKYHGLVELESA